MLNFNADLATPFSHIAVGALKDAISLNINSMFSCCVWYDCALTIANVFAGRYFSNIDYAFYCFNGTGVASEKYPIISHGTKINLIPKFSIFTQGKYIKQSKISNTYRGMTTVNDWAWATKGDG